MSPEESPLQTTRRPIGIWLPLALACSLGLQGFGAYHVELAKGRNEAWARGSGLGHVLGVILLGAFIAALFSLGRNFRSWRSWFIIVLSVSVIFGLLALPDLMPPTK